MVLLWKVIKIYLLRIYKKIRKKVKANSINLSTGFSTQLSNIVYYNESYDFKGYFGQGMIQKHLI